MNTQQPGTPGPGSIPAAADPSLDRRILLGAAGLAGVAALSAFTSRAAAGPLTPPAGPIISTGKTLNDVEPRTAITPAMAQSGSSIIYYLPNPGSYYLTGDIVVPSGATGVFLGAASTLDLNGFTISGADGTGLGVRMTAGCTVRNGRMRNLQIGVEDYFTVDADTLVEDLFVSGCTYRGIMSNIRGTVRRCLVTGAVLIGIECTNDYAVIEDCTVAGAITWGIYINSFSTMRGCKLINCGSAGGGGGAIGYGARAEHCTFDACVGTGLSASNRASIDGCTSNSTSGAGGGIGFDLADGAEIARSVAAANVIGVRASTATRIIETSAEGCTASGVRITGAGNMVESCRLTRNTIGIDMTGTGGNYVHKCVMLGNANAISVNVGGNWYPNVALGGVNTATNPLASVIG